MTPFNSTSYIECFVSENLLRRHIGNNGLTPTSCPKMDATGKKCEEWDPEKLCKFCKAENGKAGLKQQKVNAKTSIQIRENEDNTLSYLDYLDLAELVDDNVLADKDKPYRPLRNSVMHTARLTNEAKTKLTDVFNDVVATVKKLVSDTDEEN